MDTENKSAKKFRINGQWIGLSFCFFVVFHLLPTYFIVMFTRGTVASSTNVAVWLFFGLIVIGLYSGYRSRGITVIEPAIAASCYTIVFFFAIHRFWGDPSFVFFGKAITSNLRMYLWFLMALIVSSASAWIGELLQIKNQTPAPSNESV